MVTKNQFPVAVLCNWKY